MWRGRLAPNLSGVRFRRYDPRREQCKKVRALTKARNDAVPVTHGDVRAVVLGDSYAAGYGLSDPREQAWSTLIGRRMGWLTFVNAISGTGLTNGGYCGEADLYGNRVGAVLALRPEVVVVQVGLNDEFVTAAVEEAALVRVLVALGGVPDVWVIGPTRPPARKAGDVERVDCALRAGSAACGRSYVSALEWRLPLLDDRLHLSVEGHRLYAEHVGHAICRTGRPHAERRRTYDSGVTSPLEAIIGRIRNARTRAVGRATFHSSADFWARRYASGGDSGRGSYGALAEFKAERLNRFVADHGVTSVIEFGCGDGAQLALAEYPLYTGLDVAPGAIDLCTKRFGGDSTKSFYLYDQDRFVDNAGRFRHDMAISLDVIFHLVEDHVFHRYMRLLFACADRHVVIFSSNERIPDPAAHVRHREFTEWVSTNVEGWTLRDKILSPDRGETGTPADFYVYGRD